MARLNGNLIGSGMRFGVVAGRFNGFIVERLVEGAVDALTRSGVDAEAIDIAHVPGAFEIPMAARAMAETGRYDGVLCLGCVIRGSTSHYDYVCNEAAKGIAKVGDSTGVPTIFGVLTTDTIEQAIERAGTKAGNKGAEAAHAGIEMVDLLRKIRAVGA